MKTGDLILIKSQKDFKDSLKSFHNKWAMTAAVVPTSRAMAMATAMATKMATEQVTVTTTNKETNETIKLKYYGYGWKETTFPFIGIITEVIQEEDHDFDVFKIFHDNQYFYCRRMVIEGAMK